MKRVLVIEDDDDLRDTLLRYLNGVGLSARGVPSAEDVDAELARQDFDAVVCDVNLPGADGFAVLARLRARSAMRIVMLSARGVANDRLQGLSLGADYYLVKPVNLRELEMVLHNLLQRSLEAQSTTGAFAAPATAHGAAGSQPGPAAPGGRGPKHPADGDGPARAGGLRTKPRCHRFAAAPKNRAGLRAKGADCCSARRRLQLSRRGLHHTLNPPAARAPHNLNSGF